MKTRLLIHPVHDRELFNRVVAILDKAVADEPDTFSRVVDRPATVDHYGYSTDVLSSVILSEEPFSQYHRLTIRVGEHRVYDLLAALIRDQLTSP